MGRLSNYLHGTVHMEGAWPEGTQTDKYGGRVDGTEPESPFLADFGGALQGIPREIKDWWVSAHKWTRPKEHYEVLHPGDETGNAVVMAVPDEDYRAWKRLGYAEAGLGIAILGCIAGLIFG